MKSGRKKREEGKKRERNGERPIKLLIDKRECLGVFLCSCPLSCKHVCLLYGKCFFVHFQILLFSPPDASTHTNTPFISVYSSLWLFISFSNQQGKEGGGCASFGNAERNEFCFFRDYFRLQDCTSCEGSSALKISENCSYCIKSYTLGQKERTILWKSCKNADFYFLFFAPFSVTFNFLIYYNLAKTQGNIFWIDQHV